MNGYNPFFLSGGQGSRFSKNSSTQYNKKKYILCANMAYYNLFPSLESFYNCDEGIME